MEGLILEKMRLQGIHKEIRIEGDHLGAHGSALYLLVYVHMERKDIAFEHYVKQCLHDVFGQWEISVLQRTEALRSTLILWDVKIKGRDIYSD